ncbi:MAG: secondary thiamine-phosphate synthase enzyme YjbQ, partial [Acidimicrobiia bacterium]
YRVAETPTRRIAQVDDHMTTRRGTRRPEGTITVLAASESPRIRTEVLHFTTTATGEFWDLSDFVREVIRRSDVRHGQVTIHTPHTTTTIVLNESETGFLNDYRRLMDTLVPIDSYYEHDDHELRTENLQEDEFLNGHAHCRQMLVGAASATVPVVDGEILLGTWQKVLFGELDQARERRVVVHVQGV